MPTKQDDQDKLHDMVLEIDDKGVDLTSWEASFVGEMIDCDRRYFTEKQASIIQRIHDERVG